MRILLTNDDGIYAPGLAALERRLAELGEVFLVAPATEQSGVSHSITYLTPLIVKEVYQGNRRWGWAVEGSPADCVKIGISEFCPERPDLIVSGINGGLNAGINVLYSGTVAAAIEGAFYGIPSVAVSLEFDEHAQFGKAARLATMIIQQILDKNRGEPQLYNLNIPTAALDRQPEVRVVPMNVTQYTEKYQKRYDPWGRPYYWTVGRPPDIEPSHQTDISALAMGCVTLTPLDFNMTKQPVLDQMQSWQFELDRVDEDTESEESFRVSRPVVRTSRYEMPDDADPA